MKFVYAINMIRIITDNKLNIEKKAKVLEISSLLFLIFSINYQLFDLKIKNINLEK